MIVKNNEKQKELQDFMSFCDLFVSSENCYMILKRSASKRIEIYE